MLFKVLNRFLEVKKFLEGKKAHLLATALISYALLSLYLGKMDNQEAFKLIWEALFGSALRAGVAKAGGTSKSQNLKSRF